MESNSDMMIAEKSGEDRGNTTTDQLEGEHPSPTVANPFTVTP